MFITVHGTVGLIIGQNSRNPLLAFVLGLISHYLCDIIPHGDTKPPAKYNNLIHWIVLGIFDVSLFCIYLLALSLWHKINITDPNVIWAIIGSVLPDSLLLLYYLSGKKYFRLAERWHSYVHGLISSKFDLDFFTGVTLQAIVFILINLIFIF